MTTLTQESRRTFSSAIAGLEVPSARLLPIEVPVCAPASNAQESAQVIASGQVSGVGAMGGWG